MKPYIYIHIYTCYYLNMMTSEVKKDKMFGSAVVSGPLVCSHQHRIANLVRILYYKLILTQIMNFGTQIQLQCRQIRHSLRTTITFICTSAVLMLAKTRCITYKKCVMVYKKPPPLFFIPWPTLTYSPPPRVVTHPNIRILQANL